jgi:hypothetical protein
MATLLSAKAAAKVETSGNDLADVCVLLMRHRNRVQRLPGFREARWAAQDAMKGNKAISAICALVMRADDSVELVKFGPRGGTKVLARIWDRYGEAV